MAHSMGVSVIAEGIETGEHLRRLRELGCDMGQGYLWSPALHPEQVPAYVEREVRVHGRV